MRLVILAPDTYKNNDFLKNMLPISHLNMLKLTAR